MLVISQLYVPFRPSFDLSNLALDRIVLSKTEADKNTSRPMGDWTSQNWMKMDRRVAELSWNKLKTAELSWFEQNWAKQ